MFGSLTPWVVFTVIVSNIGSLAIGYLRGQYSERMEWTSKIEKERHESEAKARQTEYQWQGRVDETVKKYTANINRIIHQRDTAIAELRKRPERPEGVSEAPRIDCAGANGAELAGINAEFLERYAATAAAQDEALAACYAVLDETKK